MRKLIFAIAVMLSTGLWSQITLTVSGTTYEVTGTELLTISNAYAQGADSCSGVAIVIMTNMGNVYNHNNFSAGSALYSTPDRSSLAGSYRRYLYNNGDREIVTGVNSVITYNGPRRDPIVVSGVLHGTIDSNGEFGYTFALNDIYGVRDNHVGTLGSTSGGGNIFSSSGQTIRLVGSPSTTELATILFNNRVVLRAGATYRFLFN